MECKKIKLSVPITLNDKLDKIAYILGIPSQTALHCMLFKQIINYETESLKFLCTISSHKLGIDNGEVTRFSYNCPSYLFNKITEICTYCNSDPNNTNIYEIPQTIILKMLELELNTIANSNAETFLSNHFQTLVDDKNTPIGKNASEEKNSHDIFHCLLLALSRKTGITATAFHKIILFEFFAKNTDFLTFLKTLNSNE